jgi:hypothetical protein
MADTFGRLTDNGVLDRRAALKETARMHAVKAKQVFAALERVKKLVK